MKPGLIVAAIAIVVLLAAIFYDDTSSVKSGDGSSGGSESGESRCPVLAGKGSDGMPVPTDHVHKHARRPATPTSGGGGAAGEDHSKPYRRGGTPFGPRKGKPLAGATTGATTTGAGVGTAADVHAHGAPEDHVFEEGQAAVVDDDGVHRCPYGFDLHPTLEGEALAAHANHDDTEHCPYLAKQTHEHAGDSTGHLGEAVIECPCRRHPAISGVAPDHDMHCPYATAEHAAAATAASAAPAAGGGADVASRAHAECPYFQKHGAALRAGEPLEEDGCPCRHQSELHDCPYLAQSKQHQHLDTRTEQQRHTQAGAGAGASTQATHAQ